MNISSTIFKSIFDNATHRKMDFEDFDAFESFLYKLSDIKRNGKKDAELISPATYQAGTTRANVNVLAWAVQWLERRPRRHRARKLGYLGGGSVDLGREPRY